MHKRHVRNPFLSSPAPARASVLLLSLAMVIAMTGLFIVTGTEEAHALPSVPVEDFWGVNGSVYSVAPTGNVTYIGGDFSLVGPNTGAGIPLDVSTGSPILSFDKIINGAVRVAVPDGSGGWYIGGSFDKAGAVARNGLAHVLSDGTVDPSWDPDVNNTVYALALSGSTVYAGGMFTSVNQGTTPVTRHRLAAFNTTDGTATAWDPDVNDWVYDIAVSGSTIYAGGKFNTVNQGTTAQTRKHIAAFNDTDGTATAWDPSTTGGILNLVMALDISGSTVYVGGSFANIGGQARNNLAAVDATTGLATAWNPDVDLPVWDVVVSGSTVYAGGRFSTVNQGTTPLARSRIAAFNNTDGTATSFDANADDEVWTLAVDGSTVYAGGWFEKMGGQDRWRIAAMDASTGNLTPWSAHADYHVYTLSVSGSTIYAGGDVNIMGGQIRNNLAALDSDPFSPTYGQATSWDPDVDYTVNAVAVYGSTVYAGGEFCEVNGGATDRYYLAAFNNSDGTATAWDPDPSDYINALAFSDDGSTIYAGGDFTTVNDGGTQLDRNYLAAFNNTDGTGTAWDPDVDSPVNTLALSGSTVYAGGEFTTVNQGGTPLTRNYIAAFNDSDGTATAWDPDVEDYVHALALSGSTVYAGGEFTAVNQGSTPLARNRFAAFNNTDGTATAWDPDVDDWGQALAVSGDGSTIYAGGDFSTVNQGGTPLARGSLAAFNNSDGTANSWDPDASDYVYTLAFHGSTLYAGGYFEYFGDYSIPASDFACFAGPPSVTGITPSSGSSGGTVDVTDLAGSDFRPGVEVKLKKAGEADIDATDVIGVSQEKITCSLNLSGAALGDWDVYVENQDGQSGTLAGGFTVEEAPPPPPPTATTWYLAEGCTDGGMETFVLVQNPNPDEVKVDLTFMTSNGPMDGPQDFAIPGNSRTTFDLSSFVVDFNVSTKVDSVGGEVICERAMYGNDRTWAHDSIGVTTPSDFWYLAEGSTDGGMETFVLVQNPNPDPVKVELNFMTSTGLVPGPEGFEIPGNSRHTFKVNDYVTDYNVSTEVVSWFAAPVICERAMYGNNRTWAHDSIGYTP